MIKELATRARRMSFALFCLSLNRQEYRAVLSAYTSTLAFWNYAQVRA